MTNVSCEVAPFDEVYVPGIGNIVHIAMASNANTRIGTFIIEHVGTNNLKRRTTRPAIAAVVLLQEIPVATTFIGKKDGKHRIGVTYPVASIVFRQRIGNLTGNPLLFFWSGIHHVLGNKHGCHCAVVDSIEYEEKGWGVGFLLK
jgi:hypothetical protein